MNSFFKRDVLKCLSTSWLQHVTWQLLTEEYGDVMRDIFERYEVERDISERAENSHAAPKPLLKVGDFKR